VKRGSGSTRPETPQQALLWERIKTRYQRCGLCDRCAAQAAWGHQFGAGGWCAVKPPCAVCAELVAMFAYPTPNPAWRAVLRKRR
jgi:hypothetical protein